MDTEKELGRSADQISAVSGYAGGRGKPPPTNPNPSYITYFYLVLQS